MKFRRFSAFFLALLLAALCTFPAGAVTDDCTQETNVTTILFTHDLHSHFLPQPTAEGGESGGYARLKTVIDRERAVNPDALLVDGGDFSIGSLIQTLYTTQAAELRTMGAMGYDAVTIGNHEFDHKGTGFAEMLNSAKAAQQAAVELLRVDARPLEDMDAYKERFGPVTPVLPMLLEANYAPADDNPDRAFIRSAMENYGVTDCMTLERGGVTYGLFGLMGVDSDECAPTSGFTRTDAAKAAKRCVETLKGEGAEIIVCLSHSGTGDSLASSEDEELAKAVDGIDVIVSGHTHSTLAEPLVVNDTYIVSSGPYCQNLGSLTFSWDDGGEKRLLDYRLIPIDETVAENPEIAGLVEQWKDMVGETYLARYGLTYDEVLPKYVQMLDWLAGLYVNVLNLIQYMHDKYYYEEAEMALIDTDVRRTFATGIAGFSHVIDSLSAIKYAKVKVVRDEMGLATGFEVEGDFPKYGNDDDRADEIGVWLLRTFLEMIKKRHTYRNSEATTSILTITSNVVYGKYTGALPDGRAAFTPFAPGANPSYGAEQNGLLASLNSVAKLPYHWALDGISNTQTINPDALGHSEGERIENLVQVMDGYFDQGAHHLNVNVFGKEKLIDAMEHPEKEEYANFTIRVSGYAVKFIDLTREQQMDVISRTCHAAL